MWLETPVFKEDMEKICAAAFIPWQKLCGKTIFITGATGLVGSTVTNALLYANRKKKLDLKVLALVRDEECARQRFAQQSHNANDLAFIVGSVEELPEVKQPVDYIIHGASQTASQAFVQQPVETIRTAVHGTENILEMAKRKKIKGMTYLSSMEVYGYPSKGHKVTENEIGALSPLNVRNSYPISKQQCEALCCAYARQYGIPAMIVRLTQTFGPGVHYNDTRIFAEFGRCVKEKRDIVLKTKGETERSYLYTADAATAILTILLKGAPGAAYNAADESTYCSIAEMAQKVAQQGGIKVQFDLQEKEKCGYPETLYMDLDTTLLKTLGWTPGAKIQLN